MAQRNSLKTKFEGIGVDKPMTVEIEGKTLELDVYAGDISTFMLVGQQEEVGQEHMDDLEDTLRNILHRSYLPYYNKPADREMNDLSAKKQDEQQEEKDFIESLLARYYTDLFTGITEELGWHDGDIDASGLQNKKKAPEA